MVILGLRRERLSKILPLLLLLFLIFPEDVTCLLNLSPFESALLKTRLEDIKLAIHQEYRDSLLLRHHEHDDEVELPPEIYIFPGSGGVDELVIELQMKTPNSKIIDWKEHRGSIATAAFDGEAVGEAIAEILEETFQQPQQQQQPKKQQQVHYIGISVGAFCANAAATTTYQKYPNTNVRLTLLDPFCGRGILGSNYGRDHFGKYATTAVQILNTDDPVPTTNDPLPFCYCIDVTSAPERLKFVPPQGDSMHSWPLAYFTRHYQEEESSSSSSSNETLQRGTVVVI